MRYDQYRDPGCRRYCYFGGGDASTPPDTETPRRQSAIKRINAMFGLESPGGAPTVNREDFAIRESRVGYDDEAYQRALDAAATQESDAIKKVRESRDQSYTGHGQAVRDFRRNKINEDFGVARRNLGFSLARQGLGGSSIQADEGALLDRKRIEAFLEAGKAGDLAGRNLQSSDERTRLSLIDQINSGLDADTAAQSAAQTLENNRAAAAAGDLANTTNNAFQNIGSIYERQQLPGQVQSERDRRNKSVGEFLNQSGYRGTTGR